MNTAIRSAVLKSERLCLTRTAPRWIAVLITGVFLALHVRPAAADLGAVISKPGTATVKAEDGTEQVTVRFSYVISTAKSQSVIYNDGTITLSITLEDGTILDAPPVSAVHVEHPPEGGGAEHVLLGTFTVPAGQTAVGGTARIQVVPTEPGRNRFRTNTGESVSATRDDTVRVGRR